MMVMLNWEKTVAFVIGAMKIWCVIQLQISASSLRGAHGHGPLWTVLENEILIRRLVEWENSSHKSRNQTGGGRRT